MTLLLSLLGINALLSGTLAVLHRLEHLLGILLTHAALLLLLLLVLILILVLILLILILLILILFVLILLVLVLILVLIFILVLILVLILILVILVLVLILILVLVLLLLLQLGKTQVLARMFIIGIATQGVLVELYSLVILLTAVGDVTQVITSFATQLFVLCTLGKIGEDALGLLHRVLVVIFL